MKEASLCLASNPGSHPAFRTASDEKLDESLGSRLVYAMMDTLQISFLHP